MHRTRVGESLLYRAEVLQETAKRWPLGSEAIIPQVHDTVLLFSAIFVFSMFRRFSIGAIKCGLFDEHSHLRAQVTTIDWINRDSGTLITLSDGFRL